MTTHDVRSKMKMNDANGEVERRGEAPLAHSAAVKKPRFVWSSAEFKAAVGETRFGFLAARAFHAAIFYDSPPTPFDPPPLCTSSVGHQLLDHTP